MITFDKKKKPTGVQTGACAPITLLRCQDCAQRFGSSRRVGRYKLYHRYKDGKSNLLFICSSCKAQYQVDITERMIEKI